MSGGGQLAVRVAEAGDSMIISVTGARGGIPPELYNKVFGAYFTAWDSGTGLSPWPVRHVHEAQTRVVLNFSQQMPALLFK